MSTAYITVVTDKGAERITAALLPDGEKLKITHFAVGDGNGSIPTPTASQTALVHEVYRGEVSNIHADGDSTTRIIVEGIIPAGQGGFWVREIGLYDDQGVLIAVCSAPERYKPTPAEGATSVLNCQVHVVVSNTSAIQLKVLDNAFLPDATTATRGLTILSNATDSDDETKSATPKAVKAVMDVAKGKYTAEDASTTRKGLVQLTSATNSDSEVLALSAKAGKVLATQISAKADLSSPAFTDKPTTPTAAEGDKSQQIANTEFVMRAIAALVGSSPEALNTLNELAQALGNDPNFATTITNALAGKQPLNALLTAWSNLTTDANKLPYFTGRNQIGLTNVTSTGLNLLSKGSVEAVLLYLGLTETINAAKTALQAGNNGSDIVDKAAFAKTIGLSPATYLKYNGDMAIDADLNTFGPVEASMGIWSKGTSTNATFAKNFPEENAVGYLEVFRAGNYGGSQRFTVRNGNIYTRHLTASWNGTNGPWSEWRNVAGSARTLNEQNNLNDLGGEPALGVWRNSTSTLATAALNYPEEGSFAQGVLEVLKGGNYSYTQRYTTRRGNVYVRCLQATWDASNPQWEEWSCVGHQSVSAYFEGDLDTLTSPNRYSITDKATNVPLIDGTKIIGILDVSRRFDNVSVEQKFTSFGSGSKTTGRVFTRVFSGQSNGKWSDWREVFTSYSLPLVLGIGGAAAKVDPLDWQTYDFVPGQMLTTPLNTMKNIPAGMDWGVIDGNLVNILVGPSDDTGTGRSMLVWRSTVSTANYRFFAVRIAGTAGNRTITTRQMPVLNAAHTWAEKQTFNKGLAGDLTGNATTATKLQTARKIGGVAFDGTADIALPGVNAAGNQNTTGNAATATKLKTPITIGGVSFDGSASINLPGVNAAGNQSTSGNAGSATKLQTARTIGGVSFDGTANIDLPGVNKAGTQSTSGNAATATKLKTARTIGGVSFDGSANINLPGVNAAGNQNTSGNAATATKLQTARTISGVAFDGSRNITLTAKNVGAIACSNAWLITGDNNSSITTSSFITLLQNQGAFNTRAWTARCSFAAADSAYIPDSETKCGIIPLAGAVIEVVSFGMTNYTIRITTATTSSVSGAKTNSEFIYSYDNYHERKNVSTNNSGWRRCYNSKNFSVNLSSYVTESQLTGYNNNLDIIANTLVVRNGSNGGFAVWDISTTTSGANMYISPVAGINNVFRSTSSRRYKKDIENITDEQADKVLEMRPVWYRSTCEADNKDWGWYGLIAEEVGEIAPQYVHWRDATEEDDPTIVSSNGLVAEGVMYERLVVPLIKQVQKLTAKVEALEEELKALKK